MLIAWQTDLFIWFA